MALEHRQAYTHFMRISPLLWLLFENIGGFSFWWTAMHLPCHYSSSLLSLPSFFHAKDTSVASGQSTFVAGALAIVYTGNKLQNIMSSCVTGVWMGKCGVTACRTVNLIVFTSKMQFEFDLNFLIAVILIMAYTL